MEKKKTDKNKWIAAGLNIIPGVGYVYLQKNMPLAIGLLAIWPLSIIAAIVDPSYAQVSADQSAAQSSIWTTLIMLCFWIALIVDAYCLANSEDK